MIYLVRRLSRELSLTDEPQDWGIVNADAERLSEFVDVYRREDLTATERFDVVELVLASANEALDAGRDAEVELVRPLLPQMRRDAPVIVEYWEGLTGAEFPLGVWLRSVGP